VIDVKLTPKQKAFCDYYIKLGNATEAAIKAGYSKKTARFIGQENLTKPNIRNYIDDQVSKKEKERIADQDEVLEFLTKVLRGEETEEVPVSMTNKFEMVDKKPNIKDRTKAAELLGKRYALFKDNVNLNGDLGLNIQIDYGDEDD
jgi:phage terminase small subunit